MKFKLRSLRIFLSIFLTFLIIFETAAYIATTPRPQEGFFEVYALGTGGMANDYYPNNSPFIQTGESVTWFISVSNQMGSFQFVDIRVKLGNSTIVAPNDTTVSPSPAPLIVEFKRFIQNNETWEIPFTWQILNFTTTRLGMRIIQLQIDNITYFLQNNPTCSSLTLCQFRFIFELWTWNTDTSDFQFGWWIGDQQRIAWLQLWFNIALGAP